MNEKIETINIQEVKIANEILGLQKASYKLEAELINYYELPPLKETVEDLINSKELFLAYKLDNAIYGILSFEILNDTIDICKLFVSPNYINKGIGSKLLKKLEAEYNNIKIFIVQTGLKNTSGMNFYKKHNFNLIQVIKMSDGLEIAKLQKILIC